MKVKKIIFGLGCLCLLATGNVFASNSSPSSHCGKQADGSIVFARLLGKYDEEG